ncbi:MAG: glycosyltransferase family 4 protein [Clostridia bacterium]|nr:glycosyltransferase family 4 protein [Clostridia bacterium]
MKKILIVASDVALPGEKGLARLHYLAEYFCGRGYAVELATADFQHWEKRRRTAADLEWAQEKSAAKLTLLHEWGYKRNVEPRRILSLAGLSRRMGRYLKTAEYDLIYALVPDNRLAYVAGKRAKARGVPFVVDVEDLWPEAMRMVFDVPVVSDLIFSYFTFFAKRVYRLADAVVGSSETYADEPLKYGVKPEKRAVVYVGCDLAEFDRGAAKYAGETQKPEGAFRVSYAGTLGTSYDLKTLLDAVTLLHRRGLTQIVPVIMGDGPDRAALEKHARETGVPAVFTGYLPRERMAAMLCAGDLTVNSLIAKASQSIVSKIGDYLAAGVPMVNTGLDPEFCRKTEADGFGVNVKPEDAEALADAIETLYRDPERRAEMGRAARNIAETQFDREKTYERIVALAEELLA